MRALGKVGEARRRVRYREENEVRSVTRFRGLRVTATTIFRATLRLLRRGLTQRTCRQTQLKLQGAAIVLLDSAVVAAVAEIHEEADYQPDDEARPVYPA